MRRIDFSQDNIPVQWQYLKRNLRSLGILANFDDFELKAHRAIQKLIQDTIYEEFKLQIGADRYQRTDERLGTRQGEYERYFTTTFGTSRINIPRLRHSNIYITYSLFDKYQRRQRKFDEMVILSMILGLSTRKQRRFFRSFIGDAVSPQTASRLLSNLEEDLKDYRTKRIEDRYKYILIDGLWVAVKEKRIHKRPIVFVLGITQDNKKEIIGFKLCKGETELEITGLLNDLYRRGLEGKNLKVIASDGAKGIKAAINMVYPYSQWQLCYTHKLRNLSKNIREKIKHRKKIMREARAIYKAKSKREAIKRYYRFSQRWETIEPGAVRCCRKDFYETLVYYDHNDDKNLIGTTNHLERYLEEVRRRIKIQGYFKNEKSLNLWTYGIIKQLRQAKEPEQPNGMHYYITIIKEPKQESVQLS